MSVYTPIEVGAKQPNNWLLFDRYAPVGGEIGAIPGNWSFGNSSNYVSPFTSWSQQIVNATYDLGPYARRVSDGASGRIIISTKSPSLGEIGFVQQCWYGFDDTPYNTDDGSATGNRYLSKTEWWEACVKTTVCLKDLTIEGHPSTSIEVAIKAPEIEFQSGTTPPSYLWSAGSNIDSTISQFASPVNYGSCGVGAIEGLPEGIFGDDAGIADDGTPSGSDGSDDGPFEDFNNAVKNIFNNVSNLAGLSTLNDALQNASSLYRKAFWDPHYRISQGKSTFETEPGFKENTEIIWRPTNKTQKRWLQQLQFETENDCGKFTLPTGNHNMVGTSIPDPSWFLTVFNRSNPDQYITRVGDELVFTETYGFTPSPNTQGIGDILSSLGVSQSASDSIRTWLDFSPFNVLGVLMPNIVNPGVVQSMAAAIKNRSGIPLNTVGGDYDVLRPATLSIRLSLKNIPPNTCDQYKVLCGEDICNLGSDDDKIIIC
jgi:hypothetical protein